MSDRYIFGLIDPRDHGIFTVGALPHAIVLREHVADAVAEAMTGRRSPTAERVRAILAADFEAPDAVILQPAASETDVATWIETLTAAGNRLTG